MKTLRLTLLSLFLLLFSVSSVQAQSLLDVFFGKSSNTFRFQTPEQRLQQRLKRNVKQVEKQYSELLKQDQALRVRLEKSRRESQEIVTRYRLNTTVMRADEPPVLRKLKNRIVQQAERNRTLLVMLQFALSSRQQSLRELLECLQSYAKQRVQFKSTLERDFSQYNQLPELEKRVSLYRFKLWEFRQEHKRSLAVSKSLSGYLERNSTQLKKLRNQLVKQMTGELVKEPLPSGKTTSRPTSQPSWSVKARVYRQLLLRLQFQFFRWRQEWLRVRSQAERFDQKTDKWEIQRYAFLRGELNNRKKFITSRTRQGLWYRVSPPLKTPGKMLLSWWKSASDGWKQQTLTWNKWVVQTRTSWKKATASSIFTGSLTIVVILSFLLWLLISLTGWAVSLQTVFQRRMETHPRTKPLWQFFWLLADVFVYSRSLLFLWVVTILLGRWVEWPWSWQKSYPALWLSILVGVVVWRLSNVLFSVEASTRFFQSLDDEQAKDLRRTFKLFALFFALFTFKIPLLQWWFLPDELIYVAHVMYYAGFLLCVLWLLLHREALLMILPKDTAVGRFLILFIYQFYWLLILLIFALFAVYVAGYINFSAFLGRGLFFTLLVMSGMYLLYKLISMAAFSVLGLTRADTLQKQERRWARRLHGLVQWSANLVVLVLGASLLLQVWGVADGFTTVLRLFQLPLLQVQQAQISVLSLLQVLLAFLLAILLSRFVRQQFNESVYPALRMKPDNRFAVDTIIHYLFSLIGLLAGLQWIGVGFGALAVFVGILGIGIGFGLQTIANNFISSLIIIFGKSIKVGDVIEMNGLLGQVKVISARSTTIECLDNKIVLIPNSELLSKQVINWSQGEPWIMTNLQVGVAYGTDPVLVRDTLLAEAAEHPEILKEPEPVVRFADFGNSSLDFTLWVGLTDPTRRFAVVSEVRYKVLRRFEELGIVISFPQQDVHLRPELEDGLIRALGGWSSSFDSKNSVGEEVLESPEATPGQEKEEQEEEKEE